MKPYFKKSILVLLLGLYLFSATPVHAALVPFSSLPQPLIIPSEPSLGNSAHCQEISVISSIHPVDIPPGKPFHVVQGDGQEIRHYMCDKAPAQTSNIPTFGLSSGIVKEADALAFVPLLFIAAGVLAGGTGTYYVAKHGAEAGLKEFADDIGGQIQPALISTTLFILDIAVSTGIWLLTKSSLLLIPLLTKSGFLQSGFVKTGWPLVQGFANIGFIVALITIAALTVLRIDIGGGVKRLLPRLLLAALAINFSLLLGGILIDLSRVTMAVIVAAMDADNPAAIVATVLEKSDVVSQAYWISTGADNAIEHGVNLGARNANARDEKPWQSVIDSLIAVILIWGLAIAFLFMTATFFVRYVALLLLLIASPIAWLAVAFPGASGVVKKWWSTFLTWVAYGPIAVLSLLFLSKITAADKNAGNPILIDNLFALGLVIATLFFIATLGRRLGAIGASAAVGFVSSIPGRAARNPKTSAAIIGGLATGGIGGAAVGLGGYVAGRGALQGTANLARDAKSSFKGGIKENLKKSKLTSWAVPAERDDKGNLKKGQRSLGTALGERASLDPKARDKRRETNAAKTFTLSQNPNPDIAKQENAQAINTSDALKPDKLRTKHVGEALSEDQRKAIIQNDSVNRGIRVALASNPDAVNKMSAAEKNHIETLDVRVDLPTSGPGISQQQADQNREQNQKNTVNRDIVNAYYKAIGFLRQRSEKE